MLFKFQWQIDKQSQELALDLDQPFATEFDS